MFQQYITKSFKPLTMEPVAAIILESDSDDDDTLIPKSCVNEINILNDNIYLHNKRIEFNEQIETKIKIHHHLYDSIKNSISLIEKSQKLFSVKVSNITYNKLSKTLATVILTEKIHTAKEDNSISLEFPYLKTHADIWTNYETFQIIEGAHKVFGGDEKLIDIKFKNIGKDKLKILPINHHEKPKDNHLVTGDCTHEVKLKSQHFYEEAKDKLEQIGKGLQGQIKGIFETVSLLNCL